MFFSRLPVGRLGGLVRTVFPTAALDGGQLLPIGNLVPMNRGASPSFIKGLLGFCKDRSGHGSCLGEWREDLMEPARTLLFIFERPHVRSLLIDHAAELLGVSR